jgi:hypothetical protein
MRKCLSNSSEVFHYWANQVQTEGYSGNVSFKGTDLYSYRACIGKIFPDCVAITSRSYSNTTSGHASSARSATHSKKVIRVPYPNGSVYDNFNCVNQTVTELFKKASTARGRKSEYIASARSQAADLNTWAQLNEIEKLPFDMSIFENIDFATIAAQEKARQKIELEKRKAREIENQTANYIKLEQWHAGTRSNYQLPHFAETFLRVSGENVETSRGAKIPVRHAKRLWPVIKHVIKSGADLNRDLKLGVYRLSKIHADGAITVGCHFIKFDQLQKMAVTLNLPV